MPGAEPRPASTTPGGPGAPPPPPGAAPEPPRDWAGGVPAEVLGKVAEKLVAAETRGHGLTLMAATCKGWKHALKRDAIARAGGPAVWRDWGNLFGEGPPRTVLARVARAHVAQTEAAWAAHLRAWGQSVEETRQDMAERQRLGTCLFVFARVCKGWREAQLEVGGPLRTRVISDVTMPGRVALVKWALAEGCPGSGDHPNTLASAAAAFGHLELVKWLCGERGFAMDEAVMASAALVSRSAELVGWLKAQGCPSSEGFYYDE